MPRRKNQESSIPADPTAIVDPVFAVQTVDQVAAEGNAGANSGPTDSTATEHPVPVVPALEQVSATTRTILPAEDLSGDDFIRHPRSVCPVNAAHPHVRVYKTSGRLRYISCGTCGKHWKSTAPRCSRPLPWVEILAQRLETAASRPQTVKGTDVVIFSAADIARTAAALRQIADQSRAEFQMNGTPPQNIDPDNPPQNSRNNRGRR